MMEKFTSDQREAVILDVSAYLKKFGEFKLEDRIFFVVYLDSGAICGSAFLDENTDLASRKTACKDEMVVKNLKDDLIRYFSGENVSFAKYPLSIKLTSFQQRVLQETRKIPFGETVTYGELAQRIGTKGYRAVGQALKRNPVPVIIPCHRVVGRYSLGGYAGKVHLKRVLLALEGLRFSYPL